MRLTSRLERGLVIVELSGHLDLHTVDALRDAIADWVDKGHTDIRVTLDGLDFMDSSGLGVLVGSLKRVRAYGGTFQLVCSKPSLLRLFSITGLDRVFVIQSSLASTLDGSAAEPGEMNGESV
jgi:anti-sigma B factor antagonist